MPGDDNKDNHREKRLVVNWLRGSRKTYWGQQSSIMQTTECCHCFNCNHLDVENMMWRTNHKIKIHRHSHLFRSSGACLQCLCDEWMKCRALDGVSPSFEAITNFHSIHSGKKKKKSTCRYFKLALVWWSITIILMSAFIVVKATLSMGGYTAVRVVWIKRSAQTNVSATWIKADRHAARCDGLPISRRIKILILGASIFYFLSL